MTESATQELPNRINPAAAPAVRGSTTGVDSNDPLFLRHDGTHYVWFPGTVSNSASLVLPDPGASTVVSILARMPDGVPAEGAGANVCPVAWGKVQSEALFPYFSRTSDVVTLYARTPSEPLWNSSATALPFARSALRWVFMSVDPTGRRILRVSDSPGDTPVGSISWSTLVDTTLSTSAWTAGTTGMSINSPFYVSAQPGRGRVCDYAETSYGATVVGTWDPATQIDTTSNPNAGQTSFGGWTVNRATTGLKTAVIVEDIILPDGVNDWIQLPASDTPTFTATTGKHTQIFCGRWADDGAVAGRIWSSESVATNGGFIYRRTINPNSTPTIAVGGASTFVFQDTAGPSLAVGEKFVVALVQDEGMLYGYMFGRGLTAGTSTASVGTVTHTVPRLHARAHTAASLGSVPTLASISIPGQALTLAQLDAIAAQLIAGTY